MTRTILAIIALGLAGYPAAAPASGPSTVAALMNAHWGDEFHPGGMDGRVTALQIIGNDLYVGGEFTAVGAVPAQYVARYDGTAWHTLGDGTNGPVDALGTFQGDLVVGGRFLAAGSETTESVALWDGANWHALGIGLEAGPVAFVEEDGRLLAGGPIQHPGPPPCELQFEDDGIRTDWLCKPSSTLFHYVVAWSGSDWTAEGPLPVHHAAVNWLNSIPRGFVRFRGELLAFGDFRPQSSANCGLARLTGNGWEYDGPPQYDALGPIFPHVRAALTVGDSLILGGMALRGGSGPTDHVGVWDGHSFHALGDGFDRAPLAFALYQGRIVTAGAFTRSGPVHLNHVAWWDGTSWQPFGDGLDGVVRALAVYNGMLVAGGDFEASGTRKMRYLAAWRGTSWIPLYQNPGGGLNAYVTHITSLNGRPLVAAFWDNVLTWHDGVWTPLGSDTPFHPAGSDPGPPFLNHGSSNDLRFYVPQWMTVFQGKVMVGEGTGFAAWDGSAWSWGGFDVTKSVRSVDYSYDLADVRAFLPAGDSLIVGGTFTTAGGRPTGDVAVWDGADIRPLGSGVYWTGIPEYWLPYGIPGVHALALYHGQVVAGGLFDRTADEDVGNIAVYDGAAWHGLGTGLDDAVMAMAVYHDQLYAGGFFTEAGGQLVSHLARWDGSRWHSVLGGTDGPVFAMTVYHDRLVVGGLFQEAGGRPARNVAAVNGSGWVTLGSGVDGCVNGFTVIGDDLYLGGDIREAGGKGADHVARWTDGPAEPTLDGLSADRVPAGARIHAVASYLPAGHRDFLLWRESYGKPRTLVTADPVTGATIDVTDPGAPDAAAVYWLEEEGQDDRSILLGPIPLAAPAGLALTLAQNRPNPFAGSTRIAYRVPVEGAVDLAVFDVAGRRVAVLLHDRVPPGEYEASWDGRDAEGRPAATGIYFYRLRTPAGTLTRKLVKTE